ncbi:hypothetical protein RZN25_13545, partial [Bacillaceae bacterium S4-13-56]
MKDKVKLQSVAAPPLIVSTQRYDLKALEPIGHLRVANHEASFTSKDEKFNVLFSWEFIPPSYSFRF